MHNERNIAKLFFCGALKIDHQTPLGGSGDDTVNGYFVAQLNLLAIFDMVGLLLRLIRISVYKREDMRGGEVTMENKTVHMVSFTLLVIGGLNWGLVGLFNLDLVDAVLGNWPWVARAVYVLVGLATVVILATHRKDCETCKGLAPHKTGAGPSGQSV